MALIDWDGRAVCPVCGEEMATYRPRAWVPVIDGERDPDGKPPRLFPSHPRGAPLPCAGSQRRVEVTQGNVGAMTPSQALGAECVFCDIIEARAPATMVADWIDAIAIVPLNPVVDGHVLVIPKRHVADALEDPVVTGTAMIRAAQYATGPCNIITSAGPEATQTVMHLHVHVVPRVR